MAQMRHEWKSNIWIIIELFLVFGVIWFIMLVNISTFRILMQSKGFDDNDVYTLAINYISPESPEYVDMGEATEENNFRDQKQLIDRIRANANVEAAAFSNNALPYNFNYWGNSFFVMGKKDSIQYNGNWREASPDIVRVLRLNSETGKSRAELERMLRDGEILLARDGYYEANGRDTYDLIGRLVSNDSVTAYKVGDVVELIKRSSYETNSTGMMLIPIDESLQSGGRYMNMMVRVRPGMGLKFAEDFNSDISLRQQRNVVLSSLSSLETTRDIAQRSEASGLYARIGVMFLFLAIVFLGLLGSFWYRVQQRNAEIAMRKVCGAGRRQIFIRLMSEGSVLLFCGAVLTVMAAVGLIWHFGKDYVGGDLAFVAWCGLAALAIMELMILLGVFFPACHAMRIEPAIALKNE